MPGGSARTWLLRCRPSKLKGVVTMPTVRMPISRAVLATTGAAPLPVPPPMPACSQHRARSTQPVSTARVGHNAAQDAGLLGVHWLGGLSCARARVVGFNDAHRDKHQVGPCQCCLDVALAFLRSLLQTHGKNRAAAAAAQQQQQWLMMGCARPPCCAQGCLQCSEQDQPAPALVRMGWCLSGHPWTPPAPLAAPTDSNAPLQVSPGQRRGCRQHPARGSACCQSGPACQLAGGLLPVPAAVQANMCTQGVTQPTCL